MHVFLHEFSYQLCIGVMVKGTRGGIHETSRRITKKKNLFSYGDLWVNDILVTVVKDE